MSHVIFLKSNHFCLLRLLLAGVLVAGTMWQSAFAIPLLDQFQLAHSGNAGFSDFHSRSQTFTSGISGLLSRVDIIVDPNDESETHSLIFSVYDTTSGIPNEDSLFDLTIPRREFGDSFTSIDLTAYNLFVAVGDVFAFGLGTTGGTWNIDTGGGSLDPYAGGAMFLRSITEEGNSGFETWTKNPDIPSLETDFVFATYVDPDGAPTIPEPATLLLMALGLAGLGFARRRLH